MAISMLEQRIQSAQVEQRLVEVEYDDGRHQNTAGPWVAAIQERERIGVIAPPAEAAVRSR